MEKKIQTDIKQLLTCPLTLDIFKDPVILEDNKTYEREFIVRHIQGRLEKNKVPMSPLTRQPISISGIRTNESIKNMMDIYNKMIGNNNFNNIISKVDTIWFDNNLYKELEDPKFPICHIKRMILFCYLIDFQYHDDSNKIFSDNILMTTFMLIDKIFSLLLINNDENSKKYLNLKWYQLIGIISLRLSFYFSEKMSPSDVGLSIDDCLEINSSCTKADIINCQNHIMKLLDYKFNNNFVNNLLKKLEKHVDYIYNTYSKKYNNINFNKDSFYKSSLSYIFRILIFDYKFTYHSDDMLINVSCYLTLKSFNKKYKWEFNFDEKIGNEKEVVKLSANISNEVNDRIKILKIYKNSESYKRCFQTISNKFDLKGEINFYDCSFIRLSKKRKIY